MPPSLFEGTIDKMLDGKAYTGAMEDSAALMEDATLSQYGFVFVFWDVPRSECRHAPIGSSSRNRSTRPDWSSGPDVGVARLASCI